MTTDLPHPGEPEYLDAGPVPTPPKRRRTGVLAAASLAVVAVVGAGGWGVAQLMSGGSSPASAIPGDAVGYVSMDLDPSAAQKIEAIRTLQKFPGLRKQLDLGSRDDLRRWIFEQATKGSGCAGVDYDRDVKPWVGERIALAAVPQAGADAAYPLVALQTSDEAAARKAVAKLDGCAGSDKPTGVGFAGGYLLLTDSQAHADAAEKAAAQGSLADDPGFQGWMDRVGDPGIITAYASADAPAVLAKTRDRHWGWALTAPDGAPVTPPTSPGTKLKALAKNFQGMAAVVRFHDGSLEAEAVTKTPTAGAALSDGQTGPDIRTLPASTAAAFSFGLPHGWVHNFLDGMNQSLGGGSVDDMLKQGEAQTGLKLPDDLETLFGDGVSVSLDSSVDLGALRNSPDPSGVPVGVRIKGDPAAITRVIDKLKALAGPQAGMVQVDKGDGMVTLGLDRSYVDQLLTRGGLGSTAAFQDAVPHADKAGAVFFVNFDAGNGWAERLGDLLSHGDPQLRQNLAPLGALGISAWRDDNGLQHSLVRLTTD